jgi:hypothetical protein
MKEGVKHACSTTTAEGKTTLTFSQETCSKHVRVDVFTAVTMKNGVFWDVTPCGSCKNRRIGGT